MANMNSDLLDEVSPFVEVMSLLSTCLFFEKTSDNHLIEHTDKHIYLYIFYIRTEWMYVPTNMFVSVQ